MKIAILTPERSYGDCTPPLEMAYLAAILEQQHIVRIYDLGLVDPTTSVLAAAQRFTPDLVVLPLNRRTILPDRHFLTQCAASHAPLVVLYNQEVAEVAQALLDQQCCTFAIREGYEPTLLKLVAALTAQQPVSALPGLSRLGNFTFDWPTPPLRNLDELPFPSRHLLRLEHYGLRAVNGQLQTTVLIGSVDPVVPTVVRLRNPEQVVFELRSVARELGVRHFLLPEVSITHDSNWLARFCELLSEGEPRIFWEGLVESEHLDNAMIEPLRRAGCEALWYQFDLLHMLDAREARQTFCTHVLAAKEAGIYTRVLLDLQPPYDRLPALIDMTATFGIQDVRFKASRPLLVRQVSDSSPGNAQIEQDAQRLYDEVVSKQRMIDRFGSALGPMLWRLGLGGVS